MPSIIGSPLFHKKSKSSLEGSSKARMGERGLEHARQVSEGSIFSRSPAEANRSIKSRPYNPLASHPPLNINTSPSFDMERYHQDEEREDRFFNPRHHAEDHFPDSPESSPVKSENCYFDRDNKRRISYVYDQESQWPLKDWQIIPPGLVDAADPSASFITTPLRPRPANHQRRPTQWMAEPDVFVKRGAWKRRGIVFHIAPEDEWQQEQHFELPG